MTSTSIIVSFAILSISVGISTSDNPTSDAVTLSVYYDPYDKPSQDFLKNQLYPAFKKIGYEWMVVELVPFGLATMTPTEPVCKVECHNTANSCELDKYAACGFSLLRYQEEIVEFGACVTSPDVFIPNSVCAMEAGLTGSFDPYDCALSTKGEVVLCAEGKLTPKNITSIPLVYVDRVNPPKPDHDAMMKNLTKYICDKLQQTPPGCKSKEHTSTTSLPTDPTRPYPIHPTHPTHPAHPTHPTHPDEIQTTDCTPTTKPTPPF